EAFPLLRLAERAPTQLEAAGIAHDKAGRVAPGDGVVFAILEFFGRSQRVQVGPKLVVRVQEVKVFRLKTAWQRRILPLVGAHADILGQVDLHSRYLEAVLFRARGKINSGHVRSPPSHSASCA